MILSGPINLDTTIRFMKKLDNGTPVYGLVRDGVFGIRIICGIINGNQVRDKYYYSVVFGDNMFFIDEKDVFINPNDLYEALNLPSLERLKFSI